MADSLLTHLHFRFHIISSEIQIQADMVFLYGLYINKNINYLF